jgi:WD40 repeat protein
VISAGSDKVAKKASSETGKVVAKNRDDIQSSPTAMVINESYVGIGDEDATLTMLDLKSMQQTHRFPNLHEDIMTSISWMAHKNKYHFITTGSSTVVHVDIRKGVLTTSEDQEDEILCGAVASESRFACGMSEGVITVWNNNHLEDQQNRIRLSDESIDCMVAAEEDNEVYAAGADGIARLVDVRQSKIIKEWMHSDETEISALELDHEYRLVTASMDRLKIWPREDDARDESDAESEDENPRKSKKRAKKKQGKSKANGRQPHKHVHGISAFDGL